jgi:hypothetical protein
MKKCEVQIIKSLSNLHEETSYSKNSPKKSPKKIENGKVNASPGFEPTPTEAISMRSYAYSTAADTEHSLQSGSCLTMGKHRRSSIYKQKDL